MISVIVCSRDIIKNRIHKEHIISSAGDSIEYILIDNSYNQYSLCAAYNEGVKRASGELLLFMHDDVFPITKNWAQVVNLKFAEKKEIGALGVAGTNYLFKDDAFWCKPGRPFVKGKVIHEFSKKNELVITVFSDSGKDEEVVILDGLFMVIKADLFNKDQIKFDELNFNGFHLYDLDISMQINKSNKLFVTEDILVKHMSSGIFGEDWKTYAKIFIKKHKERLPIYCTTDKPDPKNRIPFDSPSLDGMLKKETINIIYSIGKENSNPNKHFLIAQELFNKNDFKNAKQSLLKILEESPNFYNGHHLLGLTYFKLGNIEEALNTLQNALKLNNNDPMLYYNIGSILIDYGRASEALQYLNSAIHLKSDFVEALNKITYVLSLLGELTLAKKTCETILRYTPNNVETLNNIGNICKDMGDISEALSYYQKALEIKPNYTEAFSNFLLNLHYINDNQEEIWIYHKKFGNLFPLDNTKYEVDSVPNKKIKIGYLSPDLRNHSVSYFIKPILEKHNCTEFDVFCYNDSLYSDNTTSLLKTFCNNWKDVNSLNNDQLIKMIKDDNLDIIVDLAGHSGNNRINIFAKRLAKVQITYLGYPDTTGLSQMDYRITDQYADCDDADSFYSEKLIRLEDTFLCYSPNKDIPKTKDAPALKNHYITFGSFNNFSKISEKTLSLWINILKQIPNSNLVLKCRALNNNATKIKMEKIFTMSGIDIKRISFLGYTNTLQEHLNCYNSIDISLDTYPYNGTTTTCESLLMGVPVITLKGKTHASRVGSSLLKNCNLDNLIADTEQNYKQIAINLSSNIIDLNKLRSQLRDNFLTSQVCESSKFTKEYELVLKRALYGSNE